MPSFLIRRLVPHWVLKLPAGLSLAPQMIRAPAVHDRLELLVGDAAILQEFRVVLLRKFPVISFYERYTFFACDLVVANLMCSVRSGTADTELDVSKVIVITVDAVVETSVF